MDLPFGLDLISVIVGALLGVYVWPYLWSFIYGLFAKLGGSKAPSKVGA